MDRAFADYCRIQHSDFYSWGHILLAKPAQLSRSSFLIVGNMCPSFLILSTYFTILLGDLSSYCDQFGRPTPTKILFYFIDLLSFVLVFREKVRLDWRKVETMARHHFSSEHRTTGPPIDYSTDAIIYVTVRVDYFSYFGNFRNLPILEKKILQQISSTCNQRLKFGTIFCEISIFCTGPKICILIPKSSL